MGISAVSLVPIAVLGLVPLWRFAPWLAVGLAPLVLVLALGQARRHPEAARRGMGWVGGCALLIAALRLPGDALWPCELACAGGKAFDHLAGVPLAWWSVAGSGLWLVAWWRRWAILVPLLSAMAGASLAYLVLLARLHSLCGYCLAVHVAVLAGMLLALAVPARWWWRYGSLLAMAAIVLAIHAGVDVPVPVPDPPAGPVLGPPPMAPPGIMP